RKCIGRAFWHTDRAVDAFVGVDHQEVRAFPEAIHRAYIDAVGVFAFDTVFGNDVSHFSTPRSITGFYLILQGCFGTTLDSVGFRSGRIRASIAPLCEDTPTS